MYWMAPRRRRSALASWEGGRAGKGEQGGSHLRRIDAALVTSCNLVTLDVRLALTEPCKTLPHRPLGWNTQQDEQEEPWCLLECICRTLSACASIELLLSRVVIQWLNGPNSGRAGTHVARPIFPEPFLHPSKQVGN